MTTDTLTLTAFLLARIEEDEARAASDIDHFCDPDDNADKWITMYAKRLAAECAAKRAIIEFHKSWPVLIEKPPTFERVDSADIDTMTFRASQQIMWATEQEYRNRFGTEPPTSPMIRALAVVYADHRDFNPAWA